MAFRQHARPPAARQLSFAADAGPSTTSQEPLAVVPVHARKQTLEDSQEWVLFSPSIAASTTTLTHTVSTERTPRTAGLSRLSDFGSLDTAARSDQRTGDDETDEAENATADRDDDAEELDSLDDGLHAFHEPSEYGGPLPVEQSADTVLPTHDGMGTFQPTSSALQEQLWQFEARPGHRRRPHARRRSSMQRTLDALDQGNEVLAEERERRQRIEDWRLDQSMALLEEIERETRRRRQRNAMSASRAASVTTAASEQQHERSLPIPTPALPVSTTHPVDDDENLSFLQRITRKVIRDIMGIDENLLSVIFGEALPEDVELSTTPTPSAPHPREFQEILENGENAPLFPADSWQHRALGRIARELGILVHHLSEHPGAFETYLRTQEPLPYAGFASAVSIASSQHASDVESPLSSARRASFNAQSAALFAPTLAPREPLAATTATVPVYSEASLWGIEEEPDLLEPELPRMPLPQPIPMSEAQRLEQERQYWERDLDAKMVFQFLIRKFSPNPSAEPSFDAQSFLDGHSSSTNINLTTTTARRAALIRQNHPLVAARSAVAGTSSSAQRRFDTFPAVSVDQNRRRELMHRHHRHSHPGSSQSPQARPATGRPRGSSCASQSTKRSRKSGSSRNFWDLGGSVGSVSGAGVWGEA